MKTLLFSFFFLFTGQVLARTMNIQHMTTGPSYFKVTVSDTGPLNGTFPGWCADWNTRIEDGVEYDAKFWSSLAPNVPNDVVDHPEYLDEVNWLINQNFVGKTAPENMGIFTIGDVQLAIWSMVDDEFNSDTVGEFSQVRVNYLIERAKTDGAGYEPGCRQLVGIILLPKDPTSGNSTQNTIILVPRYKFPKCSVPDTDTDI
jgi:hypothetical protein